MNRIYNAIFGIAALVLFAGCVAPQKHQTPSGRPEVTINTQDKGKIKSVTINQFINAGFTMTSDTEYAITFTKQMSGMSGVLYQSLAGNSYSSTPQWVVILNLATVGEQTRVVGQVTSQMQNAFGRNDAQDMTSGKPGAQVMEMLAKIRTEVETH
ncbi:MAG: hypothetical protein IH623_23285 [Verrucomicrobia bacterium]|nr:hypothetical protein [Verrucomicrobiota bacterium]